MNFNAGEWETSVAARPILLFAGAAADQTTPNILDFVSFFSAENLFPSVAKCR